MDILVISRRTPTVNQFKFEESISKGVIVIVLFSSNQVKQNNKVETVVFAE